MSWFLVKMVFRVICGNGTHKPQFDEQLRLILASNMKAAVEKSKRLAAEETQENDLVQWKLVAVTDIYHFSGYMDGAEMFSKITEVEHEASFIHTMQLKEKEIYNKQVIINN
jgi:Domain of unknown function (DUF4288)